MDSAIRSVKNSDPTAAFPGSRLASATEKDVPAPDALIFDLDGVLADVTRSYRTCIVETAAYFGVDLSYADITAAKQLGHANNDWILTQQLMASRRTTIELNDVIRIFQQFYEGIDGRNGLRELESLLIDEAFFRELSRTFPLAVVTGRPRVEAERFLNRFGLSTGLVAVVAMEDARAKPDPEGISDALRLLDSTRAWMIGDTPDDMLAATAAGIPAIGIDASPDAAMSTALFRAGAARVLTEVNQLKEILP